MKSIMVDGVEYVPASAKPAGNRAAVAGCGFLLLAMWTAVKERLWPL